VALAGVGVLTIASYFWHLEFETQGALSDPVGIATFVAVYLGSAVWGAGFRPAALVGLVGLVLLPVLLVLAWRRRASATIVLPFAAGTATFILLTAGQTAAGRLHLGTSQALSSRYSIASFTFWLALLIGFLVPLRERFGARRPNLVPAYVACAAAAALVISFRTIPDPDFQRTIRFGREGTVLAYRAGASDVTGEVTGVEAGPHVEAAFRWMETEGLGPWAPGGMVERMQVEGPDVSVSDRCAGAVESSEPMTRGWRLRGWIASPSGAASRNLEVVDASGSRIGVGLVGSRHEAPPSWDGFVAYLPQPPESEVNVVLVGADGRTRVCRLGA
jgi:hypothetical protein